MPPRPRFDNKKNDDKGPIVLSDRIRADEVRLVSDDDNRVMNRKEAEELAKEKGLDLLVVSLESSPPVVRMVDYGRYKYEIEKKAREAKKKQHVIEVKEVKMTVRIDDHDYEVKTKRARKFLEQGHKVKLTIRLKGRETQHSKLAFDLGNRFIVDLEDVGSAESSLRLEGRQITVHVAPLKQPEKKAPPKESKPDKPAKTTKPKSEAPPEPKDAVKEPTEAPKAEPEQQDAEENKADTQPKTPEKETPDAQDEDA